MAERDESDLPDGDPDSIVRRAPFSDNPQVGVRGQRAQLRILEAALEVFGELGYHQTGIARITDVAGCTRASFYQYFSSKEDVFRHLAGQVARQLIASAEALDAITRDEAGWKSVRAWVDRYADIYDRYQPVFEAFQAAEENDDSLTTSSARITQRHVATVRAKVAASTLPSRRVDDVIELLLNCMTRLPRNGRVLRGATPTRPLDEARLRTALTDVLHRTLFGLDERVNVQPTPSQRAGRVPRGAELLAELTLMAPQTDLTPAGARTLGRLLDAAHVVLITRGYHGTRVDDITTAAGLSHGAFYRYFENKDEVVRLLATRAIQRVSISFNDVPDLGRPPTPDGSTALRRWLRQYATAYASEAAMIRVWIEATAGDVVRSMESAAALDWGRARMARYLSPRGFGDIDSDALLLVVLLDALGARGRGGDVIEAAALVVERGLLGTTPPA
jgi:AcrR family transcriptional regulator